jgi:uncharacterized protein
VLGIAINLYLISERKKRNKYLKENVEYYFWRSYSQQEVDLIELWDGKIHAFEFKYSPGKKVRIPVAFSTAYPNASFERIAKDNYLSWIS